MTSRRTLVPVRLLCISTPSYASLFGDRLAPTHLVADRLVFVTAQIQMPVPLPGVPWTSDSRGTIATTIGATGADGRASAILMMAK